MLGDLPPKFPISLNTLHGAKWGRIRIRIAKYAKPVLNNGEARNGLARALLFNRLRGIRTVISSSSDTEPPNLMMAAVVLWSAVYLERTTNALRGHGQAVEESLLETHPFQGVTTSRACLMRRAVETWALATRAST